MLLFWLVVICMVGASTQIQDTPATPDTPDKPTCGFRLPKELTLPASPFRTALQAGVTLWPQGVVYVFLDSSLSHDDIQGMYQAFYLIESVTCIRFTQEERLDGKPTLQVRRNDSGCIPGAGGANAYLGMEMWSSVNFFCMKIVPGVSGIDTIVHELLHSLGMIHTQQRPDRDQHVIVPGNLESSSPVNYEKCTSCHTFDTPYDCTSIMQYGGLKFRKEEECNVTTVGGTRLTKSDIDIINAAYECKANQALYVGNQPWTRYNVHCRGMILHMFEPFGKMCCSKEKPCKEDQGDCNNDDDLCEEGLQCSPGACGARNTPHEASCCTPGKCPILRGYTIRGSMFYLHAKDPMSCKKLSIQMTPKATVWYYDHQEQLCNWSECPNGVCLKKDPEAQHLVGGFLYCPPGFSGIPRSSIGRG